MEGAVISAIWAGIRPAAAARRAGDYVSIQFPCQFDDQDLAVLEELGIRTLCDFRVPSRPRADPDRLPVGHGMRLVPIGFLPEGALDMLAAINNGQFGPDDVERELLSRSRNMSPIMPLSAGASLKLFYRRMACPAWCIAQAARIAPALSPQPCCSPGVQREHIKDYIMTNDYRRDLAHYFDKKVSKATLDTLTSANPRYIEAALDEIDARFGSTAVWLESLGVGPRDQLRLLDHLTE